MHALGSGGDVPVPRHFFVDHSEERIGPWQLFLRLSPLSRAFFATAALAIIVLAGLSMAQLRVRSQNGVFMMSFGASPEQRLAESWKGEFLRAAAEGYRSEDERWIGLVEQELEESGADHAERTREIVSAGLQELEGRIDQRFAGQVFSLEAATERALIQFYRTMDNQRRQDLSFLGDRLDRFATHNQIQDRRTEALMSAMFQISGPEGP